MPNHPEYPAAHGTNTSAMAEVFSEFLGTDRIDLDIRGFDAAGAAGNLNAVHHFDTAEQLREEVIGARLWGGIHYRGSSEAGVHLGPQGRALRSHPRIQTQSADSGDEGRGSCTPLAFSSPRLELPAPTLVLT